MRAAWKALARAAQRPRHLNDQAAGRFVNVHGCAGELELAGRRDGGSGLP